MRTQARRRRTRPEGPPPEPAAETGGVDPEARRFAELMAEAYDEVHRVVVGFVGNPHDVEDVMQETLLKLFYGFGTYDAGRSFRAWATTVASNAARDFLRKQRHRRGFGLTDEVLTGLARVHSGTAELVELREEKLRDCLASLRPGDQDLLWECYGQEVTAVAWAERHGVPENTVYSRLSRLRARLYDCVNRKLGVTR
ncbi:MAG: sigma-70 family RNA polymerase sigma factor [Planctomycetota bacterium]